MEIGSVDMALMKETLNPTPTVQSSWALESDSKKGGFLLHSASQHHSWQQADFGFLELTVMCLRLEFQQNEPILMQLYWTQHIAKCVM